MSLMLPLYETLTFNALKACLQSDAGEDLVPQIEKHLGEVDAKLVDVESKITDLQSNYDNLGTEVVHLEGIHISRIPDPINLKSSIDFSSYLDPT